MLNKKEVQQAGYEVIDSAAKLPTEQAEKVSQIKSILPSLVNSDGMVSVAALKDLLGEQNFASSSQGYSLNFAGKGLAKIKADEPTTKCLKIEGKQSKKFATTGNVIIRGDNLDVLKILRQNYTGKIKMIYIDPPYNTGSANFVYADNFRVKEAELIERFGIDEDAVNFFENMFGTQTHSSWLFAMYPRLKLARDLLTDDGVIFISIDDNEMASLKLMCDEIFGDKNVDCFVWHKSGDGRYGKMKNTTTFRNDHEYVLVAYKEVQKLNKLWDYPNFQNEYSKNPDNDSRGPYESGSISNTEDASNVQSSNYYSVVSPAGKVFSREFNIPKKEFDRLNQDGRIFWGANQNAVPRVKIFMNERRYTTPSSLIKRGSTYEGTTELNNLIPNINAESIRPKPSSLLFLLVQLASHKSEGSIILDFFAGSGTTAEAIMRLNAEDGGNRKFILVQWDETIDKKSAPQAHKFCIDNQFKPVISSITIERVKRAGEKIKKENGSLTSDLDIGYKVFSLTDRPVLEKTAFSEGTIKEVLYNMMTASGEVLLTSPIEEIEKNLLYKVGNSYFVLGECKTFLKRFSSNRIYINGYANIHLERWLNMLGLNKDNIKVLYY